MRYAKVGKLEGWKVGKLERGEPAFGRQNFAWIGLERGRDGRLEGWKVLERRLPASKSQDEEVRERIK